MVLMTVEAFEWIVLLTMADCATDNEIVPVKIVRTIFMTMDTHLWTDVDAAATSRPAVE